jgi:hypothetical protein
MSVVEAARSRGITEVLHFTTSNGLVGVLSSGALLAHSELPIEKSLEHITHLNCPDRSRDVAYHAYVNLSISRVNGSFFSIARNKWHATKDIYWCILSFDAAIMGHEGVLFATTNNAYDATLRASGLEGFSALFAPSVRLFPSKWAQRSRVTPAHHTTCNQAEVLYPNRVSIEFLRKVYLPTEDVRAEAEAQLAFCVPDKVKDIELVVASELFT